MKPQTKLNLAKQGVFALILIVAVSFVMPKITNIEIENFLIPVRFMIDLGCLILFYSIFIVNWNAYGIHRKSRSVILSIGFLCVAIFHFYAFFSATNASFILNNSATAVAFFSITWRTLCAILLVLIAVQKISRELTKSQSRWLLTITVSFVGGIGFASFYTIPQLSPSFLDQKFTSNLYFDLEVIGFLLFIYSSKLYYQQAKTATSSQQRSEKIFLFVACSMLAIHEFCFSSIHDKNLILEIIGLSSKLIAVICLYFSIVSNSIRAPFNALTQARQEILKNQNRLNGIIQTATDGIITINSHHQIILVNAAAENYFGYENGQMIQMNLNQLIPLKFRHGHAKHVSEFGKTGLSIRQMGSNKSDFTVTGLKRNGEEFPVEASISSLVEEGEQFYTVIFRDISERIHAQQKMEQYHRELSALSQSLQTVREEERKHIARELHDDLGQLLAALRMDLSLLAKKQDNPNAMQAIMASMDKLMLNAIATLRRIATHLRPRALDEGGLYFALSSLIKEFNQRHEISCELIADEHDLTLNDAISTTVYRVIQESLTNVVRHAQASKISIKFTHLDDKLQFSIRDNGRGITPQDFDKNQSFGLVGMRERVRALEGELNISGDKEGTTIAVILPI